MTVRIRVIPCLDVAEGRVVKGVNFVDLKDAGDPVEQARAYDDPLYGPDARQDLRGTLSASLLFVDFDTYGFAPKLTLEATQTNSNITRF